VKLIIDEKSECHHLVMMVNEDNPDDLNIVEFLDVLDHDYENVLEMIF
jgi:hypothetical protein